MLKSKKSDGILSRLTKASRRNSNAEQISQRVNKKPSNLLICIEIDSFANRVNNGRPLQLPVIFSKSRNPKTKINTKMEGVSKKFKFRNNGFKYTKDKLKAKSFIENHTGITNNYLNSKEHDANVNEDLKNKSIERHELFNKQFTNVNSIIK